MPKGSGNPRGRPSDSSKPYDVSNSFVKRVASRVTELLPQPSSWLSRWMSPSLLPNANDYASHSLQSHVIPRAPATSRAELNAVDSHSNHIPAKRARIVNYDSPVHRNNPLQNIHVGTEDISPITSRGELVVEPSCSKDRPEIVASTPAQRQNSSKLNGDDCSETSESTGGCSSLVPQAESSVRTLGGSRFGRNVHPSILNADSLHRRGPSFSATALSSTSFRTSIQNRIGRSPFYSGRTMYGGSSQAYMVTGIHTPQRRVGPKVVKPVPTQQALPLSSTAKRILDALEQFSTPVIDAKRMPIAGSKRKYDASLLRYTEMSIPTTPELLRVKRRERLQLSTSAARQSASTSTTQPPSPTEYIIRKEEDRNRQKQSGKVKRKEKVDDELPVEVKLPPVVLSVDSLPKIDIAIPAPPSPASVPASCSEFSFSTPTAVVPREKLKLTSNKVSTSSFKFSAPISESLDSGNKLSASKSPNSYQKNQCRSNNSEPVKSTELSQKKEVKSSKPLEPSGLVLVQSSSKSAECKTCNRPIGNYLVSCSCVKINTSSSVDNVSNVAVCNCQTSGSSNTVDTNKNHVTNSSTGFGNLFNKPLGTWECSTCMIQNKNDANRCIACESEKPGDKVTTAVTSVVATSTATTAAVPFGFGAQHQKMSGSWECESCMLINKADTSKCPACETSKPGLSTKNVQSESVQTSKGFGDLLKKVPGTWCCEICLVSNSADKVQCVACETGKPGVIVPKTAGVSVTQFSFGIPSASSTNEAATFSFGIPKDIQIPTSNITLNLLKTESNNKTCKSAPVFSFGIPKIEDVAAPGVSSNSFPITTAEAKTSESTSLVVSSTDKGISRLLNEPAKKELGSFTIIQPKVANETSTFHVNSLDTQSMKPSIAEDKINVTTTPLSFTFSAGKTTEISNKPNDTNQAPAKSASNPLFMFGAQQRNLGSNVASSTTNTISSSSAPNIFNFGNTKTVVSSSGISSIPSINASPSVEVSSASNFNTFGTVKEKQDISFGSTTTLESQQVSKSSVSSVNTISIPSTPAFGLFTNTQTPMFGSSIALSRTFVSKEQTQTPFTSTTPVFGSADNKNCSTTSSFTTFGQASVIQTVPQENKTFTFGSAPSKDTQPAGMFSFHANENKPPEPFSSFPTEQATAEAPKLFGFNNVATPTTTPSPFNFQPSQFNTAGNQPSAVFGTQQPAAAPVFGEATISTPVFAFGQQPQQTPSNPVYDFGLNQQQQSVPVAASSTTFVFGANHAPAPAAPAFNPNVKPKFDFTQGSTPTFSATPTVNSTQRKIRKAVRRNVSGVRQT